MDLYFDESGTTGVDLNNAGTPVFIVASNNLSAEKSKAIKHEIFGTRNFELKYSELKRSEPEKLQAFFRLIKSTPENFAYFPMHKPFVLLIQLLRFWYEPMLNLRGQNIEAAGLDMVWIANVFYTDLRSERQYRAYFELMASFQAMMSRYDPDAFEIFWGTFDKFITEFPHVEFADQIVVGRDLGLKHYQSLFDTPRRKSLLYIHLSAIIALVVFWQVRVPGVQFNIIHDQNSELEKHQKYWIADFCSEHGYVKGHTFDVRLPLPVASSKFNAQSDQYTQIEISDLLAGAAADYWQAILEPTRELNRYLSSLEECMFVLNAGGVYPDLLAASRELERRRQSCERANH